MRHKALELCKQRLLDMQARLTVEVNRMAEAVSHDLQAPDALSHVPTHLADQAMDGLDAGLALLQNEQELRTAVGAALDRFDNGTYGRCQTCGGEIAAERLSAIPYAESCITCAEKLSPTKRP
jgi:RNA polymerase-binding transcription factor DksA